MKSIAIQSSDAPPPVGEYAQTRLVSDVKEWLFISGQISALSDHAVPEGLREQCHLAWSNVGYQLEAAGMDVENLVKLNVFVRDRQVANLARETRATFLGSHNPAMTVIIAEMFESKWPLEIEAIAAR